MQIDTRLDVPNNSGLRTPAEIESLIAAMDVMVTTRLHGTVLALRNGVPAIPLINRGRSQSYPAGRAPRMAHPVKRFGSRSRPAP